MSEKPPWVTPDGRIDYSLMPEEIPLLGEDGLPLLDQDGNPVVMTRKDIASRPPDGPVPPGSSDGERQITVDENGYIRDNLT